MVISPTCTLGTSHRPFFSLELKLKS